MRQFEEMEVVGVICQNVLADLGSESYNILQGHTAIFLVAAQLFEFRLNHMHLKEKKCL